MRVVVVILAVFVVAFLTSWLLDWWFVAGNWVRYGLVCLLILFELVVGFYLVKQEVASLRSQ